MKMSWNYNLISRHDLSPAVSDWSDRSDKVRGNPGDPLVKIRIIVIFIYKNGLIG